jgi:hypothetical protein
MMTVISRLLPGPLPRLLPGLLLTAVAIGAQASGMASSASDGVGLSLGSLSRSFDRSSDGSSRRTVAQGDYRVIEVAQTADGEREVRLQAVAGTGAAGDFTLRVTQAVAERGALAPGQVVRAEPRAYGVQFARADDGGAFLLLLDDDWFRELRSVALDA